LQADREWFGFGQWSMKIEIPHMMPATRVNNLAASLYYQTVSGSATGKLGHPLIHSTCMHLIGLHE
jgi:hypothetical protein